MLLDLGSSLTKQCAETLKQMCEKSEVRKKFFFHVGAGFKPARNAFCVDGFQTRPYIIMSK